MNTGDKIRNTPEMSNVWGQLVDILESFTVDMGKAQAMDDSDMKRLIDHIKREFPDLTLSEIEQSFSLYTACKLDFKNEKFQGINKLFLGNVLGAYRRYKASHLARLQAYERDNTPKVDETIQARVAHNATISDLWEKIKKHTNDREVPLSDEHGIYYDLLTKGKLFQPDKNKKALAYKQAKQSILTKGMTHNESCDPRKSEQFKHFKNINTDKHNTFHIRTMHLSKQSLFRAWVNECIEMDYDFKHELEGLFK